MFCCWCWTLSTCCCCVLSNWCCGACLVGWGTSSTATASTLTFSTGLGWNVCCATWGLFGSCPSRLNPRPLYRGKETLRNGCGTCCCGSKFSWAMPRPCTAGLVNVGGTGRCWPNATVTIKEVATNTVCKRQDFWISVIIFKSTYIRCNSTI